MPEVERALRDKARQRLQDGVMPMTKPTRTWGGPGAGLACAVCELPINKEQVEYEVQFLAEGARMPDIFHLHLSCFAAWELERGLMNRAADAGRLASKLSSGGHERRRL
jgi:hypothetical protein